MNHRLVNSIAIGNGVNQMSNFMLTPGMIGFSNNKTSFFGKLIRFFTRSNITHSFLISFPNVGQVQFIEASKTVNEGSFEVNYVKDTGTSYIIYKIKDEWISSPFQINIALEKCRKEFLGVSYGYLQLLWFPYRWLMEKLGKDVRHENNWLSQGVICSELVYYFLVNVGLGHLVLDFNPDTIQAQDILSIIEARQDIFELVETKE